MQTLVMSHLACVTCVCMYGAHALGKPSVAKYLSGLAYMQADLNLAKINASHFWVLNTQNAKIGTCQMFLIAYLNGNFTDCNENSA